jgi:hypothetical protein
MKDKDYKSMHKPVLEHLQQLSIAPIELVIAFICEGY